MAEQPTDREPAGAIAKIAAVVGHDCAIQLSVRFGGREIHMPRPDRLLSEHPIASIIGLHNAQQIAERFQGETLYIPLARRAVVVHMASQGAAVAAIAATLGISTKTVKRYLRD